jgi:hypothetical protein
MNATLLLIGTLELYLATLFGVVFIASYIFMRKRSSVDTPLARAILFMFISITLVLLTTALGNLLGPDFEYRALIRIVAFGTVPVAMGNMIAKLYFMQSKSYRERYDARYYPKSG